MSQAEKFKAMREAQKAQKAQKAGVGPMPPGLGAPPADAPAAPAPAAAPAAALAAIERSGSVGLAALMVSPGAPTPTAAVDKKTKWRQLREANKAQTSVAAFGPPPEATTMGGGGTVLQPTEEGQPPPPADAPTRGLQSIARAPGGAAGGSPGLPPPPPLQILGLAQPEPEPEPEQLPLPGSLSVATPRALRLAEEAATFQAQQAYEVDMDIVEWLQYVASKDEFQQSLLAQYSHDPDWEGGQTLAYAADPYVRTHAIPGTIRLPGTSLTACFAI